MPALQLQPPEVIDLGLRPYAEVWAQMKQWNNTRSVDTRDEIWLVEHYPVFTLGQAGREDHLLDTGDIPVVKSDRGGQVTYHGPGQIILYLMLDLRRLKVGVRNLVSAIEASVIALLQEYNIEACARPDAPGVYVNGSKIASLGLRVRKGCSYHGLSLNFTMDLEPYSRINVCGYPGLSVVQLADLVEELPEKHQIVNTLINNLTGALGYRPVHE